MKHALHVYGQANKNPAMVPPMNRATEKGKGLERQVISYVEAAMGSAGNRLFILDGSNNPLVQLQEEKG